jgi:hypothetical protein
VPAVGKDKEEQVEGEGKRAQALLGSWQS